MTPYGSVNLTEMVLEHPFRFLTLLRTSEMFVKPFDYLLRVCEILRHCRGQCLRIVFDLWVFDLEVYFVTFVFVTYC